MYALFVRPLPVVSDLDVILFFKRYDRYKITRIHWLSTLDGCEAYGSPVGLSCGHLLPISPHGYYFTPLTDYSFYRIFLFSFQTSYGNFAPPIRPRYYGCFQPSSRKLWFVPRNWFFRPALVTLSGHHFITGSTFLSGRSPQAPAQGVINPRLIPKIRMYSHRGKTDTEGSAQLY